MRCCRRRGLRQRGAALLLVLWLVVLLTALVGGYALMARTEHLQGNVLVRGVAADAAARAGLEYAAHRLALDDPALRWLPDGRPYPWRYAGAEVEVRIIDEDGKVDLNRAGQPLLSQLLEATGQEPARASRLAAAIVDWRDHDSLSQPAGGAEDADYASAGRAHGAKDADFEGIAELEQVLGFDPDVYAALAPHVTVYSARAQPDPAYASATVLEAMGLDGELIEQGRRADAGDPASLPAEGSPALQALAGLRAAGRGSGTYSIDSRARLADGRESVTRALVRVGGYGAPGRAYTVLAWEQGASAR